jgi:Family of unknown function (DUF5706)
MPPVHQEGTQGEEKFGRVRPIDQAKAKIQDDLDLVHWHMLRGDGLRASLVNRAGSVLNTNALIVAGVALAIGLRSQHPGLAVVIPALAALVCVAASVVNASMVMVTLRPWRQHFKATNTPPAFLYSYAGMHGDFAEFKANMLSQSPEQLLEYALVELWRTGNLHNYRYRKLRIALRWLLTALAFFFIAIALSAI